MGTMLCDLDRVRAAQRSGARLQQIYGIHSVTKRSLKPETIVHGPDGDLLILARWGRVTLLGRMWDEECARHLCVKMEGNRVPLDNKEAIAAIKADAPNS